MVTAVGNSKAFLPAGQGPIGEFRVSRPNVLWLVDYGLCPYPARVPLISRKWSMPWCRMIHANRPGAETGPGPPIGNQNTFVPFLAYSHVIKCIILHIRAQKIAINKPGMT